MHKNVEQNPAITRISPANRPGTLAARCRRLSMWIRIARRNRHSRRARRVTLMLVLLWVTNGFDLAFTLLATRLGGFEELNPVAASLLANPALLAAFKVFMVLLASIIFLKYRRRLITEVACWCLSLVYLLLSGIWWLYYFLHN